MFKLFKARILVWPLILMLVLLIAGGIFLVIKASSLGSWFGTSTQESSSQVITSITRTEEVSLLSLGVQGIDSKKTNSKVPFLGMDIPGSERATFLQYEFKAKLGIDGKKTKIEQIEEDTYRVSIPEFIFIGHDDVTFELVVDNSGGISLITPQIEQLEMVNKILDSKAQEKYIANNEDVLRDQAKSFYTGIVNAIDPNATLEFVFAGEKAAAND